MLFKGRSDPANRGKGGNYDILSGVFLKDYQGNDRVDR